jgi:hypothetical protein
VALDRPIGNKMKVHEQNHDHGASAVGMQTAQERAGGDDLGELRDGGVGVIGGGHVVERQKTPVMTWEIKIDNKPEPKI